MKTEKKPVWLRTKLPSGKNYSKIINILKDKSLHTVCQEAKCPNMGECFSCGKATFMILGNICTRNCGFCAVTSGIPGTPDREEPQKIGLAISRLNLNYTVITSVTRDDLPDGGAEHFVKTVEAIRKFSPQTKIELLIPDLKGDEASLKTIVNSKPYILNHNVETVPALYETVRPRAVYERSIDLIGKARNLSPELTLKSGIMVGLGETKEQVIDVIKDLIEAGCHILTIGQYLAPSQNHIPVKRYLTPEEFNYFREEGEKLGMRKVVSAPLIRSSYFRGEF